MTKHFLTSRQGIALLLALFLLLSRPYPLSGIIHLADATNAIFFIGGLIGLSALYFSGFVILTVVVDFVSIALGTDPFCISPAYVFQIPAFAALWYGGSALAKVPPRFSVAAGLAGFSLLQCLAFLITSGSFYFLSGKFEQPDMAGMLARSELYMPGYFLTDFWYVLIFLGFQTLLVRFVGEGRVHER